MFPGSTPQLLPTPASQVELLQSCHKGAQTGEENLWVARSTPRRGWECQDKDPERPFGCPESLRDDAERQTSSFPSGHQDL